MAEFDKAFVSPDIVRVDDKLYKSVVMAKRFPGNELNIAIYPFGLPSTLGNLMVLINQDDLAEVQKLLGEERQVLTPHGRNDLATAIEALKEIARAMEGITSDDLVMTWQDIAKSTIYLAQNALNQIAEADDGTPSDS